MGGRGWTALAAILFALATLWLFEPVLETGLGESVPLPISLDHGDLSVWRTITEADLVYEVWLVSRNARALLGHPLDFFEAPHCAPLERSVTLGIPMVAMGVLAVPFTAFTDDPILVYNLVLMTLSFLACVAMFLLVRSWTGVPAAGIVAGLLYGFSAIRLGGIVHPSQHDDIWTVFALFFAYRLFAGGRWRDALGLSASFALQATESFYPFLAAVLVAPPLLVWMLASYRFERTRASQWVFVAVVAAAVMAWMYLPYLEARSSGLFSDRSGLQRFAPLSGYLPGGEIFPGFVPLAFAAVALVSGRRGLARELRGDPRLPLLIGAVLVAWVASGPYAGWELGWPVPDLYSGLGSLLPGLDSIRVVFRLSSGVSLAVSALAGIGAAAFLRWTGRYATAAAWAAIGITVATAVAGAGGLPASAGDWTSLPIAEDPGARAFYGELAKRGNTGPVFELPFDEDPGTRSFAVAAAPPRIFANHYHNRKISTCFGSFYPPTRGRLGVLASKLPAPEALDELAGLGFTTIVAHHHRIGSAATWQRRMGTAPVAGQFHLRPIAEREEHSAWEIAAPPPERGSEKDTEDAE